MLTILQVSSVDTTDLVARMPARTLDEQILDLLRRDARATTAALARRLGVARSTVQGRIERLERTGVIRGYTVQLAPAALSRQVEAHVMIAVDPAQQAAVERRLKTLPAVTQLLTVSGSFDLVAMIGTESTEALDTALDAVRECPGVKSTQTAIVLSRRFAR
jgi:DNA-binding Lrp family transcriptional regulator